MKKDDWYFDNKKEFRKLIYELYEIYPNGRIPEKRVHPIIVTLEDRKEMNKLGLLIEEHCIDNNGKSYNMYGLGPAGLSLISSWENEKIANRMLILTYVTITFAVISIIIQIIK
ncbi:MAG: hypothetical protein PHN56_01785 [Candidatus Nanoarchaeia archaeon]|nr:hypothetical protein [Candidatus Nanoarchaeia archaeon]